MDYKALWINRRIKLEAGRVASGWDSGAVFPRVEAGNIFTLPIQIYIPSSVLGATPSSGIFRDLLPSPSSLKSPTNQTTTSHVRCGRFLSTAFLLLSDLCELFKQPLTPILSNVNSVLFLSFSCRSLFASPGIRGMLSCQASLTCSLVPSYTCSFAFRDSLWRRGLELTAIKMIYSWNAFSLD